MGPKFALFASLAIFLFLAGCLGQQQTIVVTLPHSGENVTLLVTLNLPTPSGGNGGSLYAFSEDGSRSINYETSWHQSSGGGGASRKLTYTDANISYQVLTRISGRENWYYTVYNCTRGDCGFHPVLNNTNYRQQTLCFSNGSCYTVP